MRRIVHHSRSLWSGTNVGARRGLSSSAASAAAPNSGIPEWCTLLTKQDLEVRVVEGFGPEPGEQAEPIAMGRQTIWGGAGKPPSRDVMAAAAKAARTEMMQRMRDNKQRDGAPRGGQPQGQRAAAPKPAQGRGRPPQSQPRHNGGGDTGNSPRNINSNTNGNGNGQQRQPDPLRTSVDSMADRGRGVLGEDGFGGPQGLLGRKEERSV